jgi:starch synthase
LLEVHNLPYLGAGAESALKAFGLPPIADSPLPDWADHLPLPLGLVTADHIVTVSPGYAKEILTPEFGAGLHAYLQTRVGSITGILNGLDLEAWDPATDERLKANFAVSSLPLRSQNKTALQEELEFEVNADIPLLGMITRMDHQKGVDLALGALTEVSDLDWQAVILGTGNPDLEEAARQLQSDYPDRVRAEIRFDAGLARRIYGGVDALLIPSRYEPCGLAQMIAMRYGCVPVARATGGLQDTIRDYHGEREGTGFLFEEASAEALGQALRRTLEVYGDKRRWKGLQRRGMGEDFSWERSALRYLDLYQDLVRSART